VNALSEYDVAFVKYRNGSYRLAYKIGDAFLENFEYSSLKQGAFRAEVEFIRQETQMEFNFTVSGRALVECDRCLDMFYFPIENTFRLIVRITPDVQEEEEHILYISPSEHKINLAQYLYEMIHLALPMKKICEDGGKECSRGFVEQYMAGAAGKSELKKTKENEELNPEWEKLKDLFKEEDKNKE
jgi:uncharacterized protein